PQVASPGSGWSAGQWDVDTGAAKFDLYLEMEDEAGGLTARFMYRTDLFKPETIERLKANFTTLLEGIAANPAQNLGDLPLLTQCEGEALLTEWNATQVDYPADLCMHSLVENAAQQSPAAIALTFKQQTVTYAELEKRSNQLAHRLREAGVGPET